MDSSQGVEISVRETMALLDSEKRSMILDIRSETAFHLSRISNARHVFRKSVWVIRWILLSFLH